MLTRILIAGSDSFLSDETLLLLKTKGYQIFTYRQYADAVGHILEDPPDLLVVEKGFDSGMDIEVIKAVKACLQKTNIPVFLVLHETTASGLDWSSFQVDDLVISPMTPELFLTRIELAEARMLRVFDNNPLTKLPGNTSIIRAITKAIGSEKQAAVCYVDIDNFKPYNDRYGFSEGDDVILMVARIIVNVLDELARKDSFIGHVGGDDFVFIVPAGMASMVCERVLANFETVKTMFISKQDLQAGGYTEKDRLGRDTRFGLLSLSIAVILVGAGRFKHYGEISATASQLKHHVKQTEGSNYIIDRRTEYCKPQ